MSLPQYTYHQCWAIGVIIPQYVNHVMLGHRHESSSVHAQWVLGYRYTSWEYMCHECWVAGVSFPLYMLRRKYESSTSVHLAVHLECFTGLNLPGFVHHESGVTSTSPQSLHARWTFPFKYEHPRVNVIWVLGYRHEPLKGHVSWVLALQVSAYHSPCSMVVYCI